jgi:methionine sulfoxide reductase catalytic subunit
MSTRFTIHGRSIRNAAEADILPSEITPQDVFLNRRALLTGAVAAGLVGVSHPLLAAESAPGGDALKYTRNPQFSVSDKPNSYEDITSYNNFYELGTDKSDPKANAESLKPHPWNVTVDGEAEVKGTFAIEDILKPHALEERVYRFRCVEAWSMIIPWVGFPLGDLIKRFKPTSKAKYVEMTTLLDPKQLPYQRTNVLDWPYIEGLRMDEAMHPLTLMVTGLYGRALPAQNGAPLRLMAPWKYGFKNVKSIVKIKFVEKQPQNTWMVANPREYGFYANVNPEVDHPRWSQGSERKIGGGSFFAPRVKTLPFNGYADQVASLYKGMDLRRFF